MVRAPNPATTYIKSIIMTVNFVELRIVELLLHLNVWQVRLRKSRHANLCTGYLTSNWNFHMGYCEDMVNATTLGS